MANAIEHTVSLQGGDAEFVDEMLAKGSYASADEVVCAGLAALRDRDATLEDWLHRAVAPAYDRLKASPECTHSAQTVFDGIRARHRRRVFYGGQDWETILGPST